MFPFNILIYCLGMITSGWIHVAVRERRASESCIIHWCMYPQWAHITLCILCGWRCACTFPVWLFSIRSTLSSGVVGPRPPAPADTHTHHLFLPLTRPCAVAGHTAAWRRQAGRQECVLKPTQWRPPRQFQNRQSCHRRWTRSCGGWRTQRWLSGWLPMFGWSVGEVLQRLVEYPVVQEEVVILFSQRSFHSFTAAQTPRNYYRSTTSSMFIWSFELSPYGLEAGLRGAFTNPSAPSSIHHHWYLWAIDRFQPQLRINESFN